MTISWEFGFKKMLMLQIFNHLLGDCLFECGLSIVVDGSFVSGVRLLMPHVSLSFLSLFIE